MFLSSTFRDMHAERDHLSRMVFPELRSRCEQRGVEFVGIDLRWGITQEEAERTGTLAVCLEEIDRCRPFFVCLLGDRFGWVPPPDAIPEEFFERVRHAPAGLLGDEIGLETWYRLDETSVPPVRRLRLDRPITEEVATALADFWEAAGLPHAGDSITAREILHGVLEAGHPSTHALVYIRKRGPHLDPAFPSALVPVFVEQDPRRRAKLEALGQRIRERADRVVVRDYEVGYAGLRIESSFLPSELSSAERDLLKDGVIQPAEWPVLSPAMCAALEVHGTVAPSGIEALGEQVLADLWSAIDLELAEPAQSLDAHARERTQHERFLVERTRLFVGREDLLLRLLAYVGAGDDHEPLVVTGPPGSGKSALLAETARRCREQFPNALVVPHFIGAIAQSVELTTTLRSLCEVLRRACAIVDQVPEDPDKLRVQLPVFLEKAGSKRPVILVLDALNQLDPRGRSHDLGWFPFRVPSGVRVIASTLAGACLDRLRALVTSDHVVEVSPLSETDRIALVREHLGRHRKKLTSAQLAPLLDTGARADAGLPLYLLVALNELCLFGNYPALEERIARLPPTLPELFSQVLARLEYDHGLQLTEEVCTSLAVSRSGLQEVEVLDVLAATHRPFPAARWTRFYHALEPYLRPRDETTGAGLLGFFHDQLRIAVYDRFLGMASPHAEPTPACLEVHRRLAAHFRSLCCDASGTWHSNHPRGLRELPFHQLRGRLWADLDETLGNLTFIEATCRAGVLDDLQIRYEAIGADPRASTADPLEVPVRRRLEAFGTFVATNGHLLRVTPSETIPVARNHACNGVVAQLGDRLAARLERPWIALENRPASLSSRPLCRRVLVGHGRELNDVALSADGAHAISGGEDGGLRVWDVSSGACIDTLFEVPRFTPEAVTACALTADGRIAAAGYRGGAIRIWDVSAGRCVRTFESWSTKGEDYGPVGALAIAPDGQTLVSARGARVRVWDLSSGACSLTFPVSSRYRVTQISVAPNGTLAAIAQDRGPVELWDLARGERRRIIPQEAAGVAISADARLAGSVVRGRAFLWDLATGACLREIPTRDGTPNRASRVALSPDGSLLLCPDGDRVRVIDVAAGICRQELTGHSQEVVAVALAGDRRTAVSASRDRTLRVWDIGGGQDETAPQHDTENVQLVALAPSPAGATVAAATVRDVGVWDFASRVRGPVLGGHDESVTAIAMTPDGRLVLTGDWNRTVRIWDATTGACLHAARNHRDPVSAIATHPTGALAASLDTSGALRVFTLPTGRTVRTWGFDRPRTAPGTEHGKILFDADGRRILTVGSAWDIASGTAAQAPERWRRLLDADWFGWSRGYAFSDDRTHVLLNADPNWSYKPDSGQLAFQHLGSGACVGVLRGHDRSITGVEFTPCGRFVVSASLDGTVRLWELSASRCVATFDAGADVVSLSSVGRAGEMTCSTRDGRLLFLSLRNIVGAVPAVMAVRRFRFLWESCAWPEDPRTPLVADDEVVPGAYDSGFTALCPWCGRLSDVPEPTLEIIADIDAVTALRLPTDAWEHPALASTCTQCLQPLRFKPFRVDNSPRLGSRAGTTV